MARTKERNKAIQMRQEGCAITIIAQELGVSKSSVSMWVRDIALTQEQLEKLRANRCATGKGECIGCGKEFVKNSYGHVYCSQKCRRTNKAALSCIVCATTLQGNQTHYCSSKCKQSNSKRKMRQYICSRCKKEFSSSSTQALYCSRSCSSKDHGFKKKKSLYENLPDKADISQGYRTLDKNLGYVRIRIPSHPKANTWGYVYEHIVIAEYMVGRLLRENEVVHHINEIKWDNRPENLEILERSPHNRKHALENYHGK